MITWAVASPLVEAYADSEGTKIGLSKAYQNDKGSRGR
jgi:hypothetical protein